MKFTQFIPGFTLICLGSATLFGAVPDTLSLEDLQGHPERWPRTLRMPQDFKTATGGKIEKGQSMVFVRLNGDRMTLEFGTEVSLQLPAANSGLVEEANKLWSKLTPAQRALDAEKLSADASLWPERVKVLEQLDVSHEWGRIEAGTEFPLISCEPDGVQLGREDLPRCPVIVDTRQTDVFEQARARVLLPAAQRPSRIVAVLQGRLVDAQGKSVVPAQLADTQLFAVYFGAGWCKPCRQFLPQMIKTLEPLLAQNPRLTVVYLSNDKTSAAAQTYMQSAQMPWPGVNFAVWSKQPQLMSYARGTVPQLVIIDRHGRVLADSFNGDRYVGPQGALKELLRLLASGVAK